MFTPPDMTFDLNAWRQELGPLTQDDLSILEMACADAQICWRKRRQHAQGLIDLSIPGGETCQTYTEEECTEQIAVYKSLQDKLYRLVDENFAA